jgi:hypothetical protein
MLFPPSAKTARGWAIEKTPSSERRHEYSDYKYESSRSVRRPESTPHFQRRFLLKTLMKSAVQIKYIVWLEISCCVTTPRHFQKKLFYITYLPLQSFHKSSVSSKKVFLYFPPSKHTGQFLERRHPTSSREGKPFFFCSLPSTVRYPKPKILQDVEIEDGTA